MEFLAEGECYSELTMREDMYKVIVERPRRGKEGDATAARLLRQMSAESRYDVVMRKMEHGKRDWSLLSEYPPKL